MKNIRKRNFRSVLLLALAVFTALAFTACSGKDADSKGTDGTDAKKSDTLVVGLTGSLATLDLNQNAGIVDYYVAAISQEGLTAVSNEGKLVPGLAESWETSEDGTTWTFKLRADAQFYDGSAVTAEDVVFSAERARDPEKSPGVASYFPWYVDEIKATAPDEVTFTLDGPHPGFLWNISNSGVLLVSKKSEVEAAKSYGSPEDLISGTGPYKPVEFVPGSHVTYEYSETWRGEKPQFQTIRFDFIEDNNTRLLAFKQGDIDFTYNIPSDSEADWSSVEGSKVFFVSDRSYQGLTFNPNLKPFDDIHVRKAVAYAIDGQGIVDGLLKGHAQAATAITAPEQYAIAWDITKANEEVASVTHYEYNIEQAKAELAQSKYQAADLKAEVTYPASDQNLGKAVLAIAESLKSIGFELKVTEEPIEQWLTKVSDGQQAVATMSYIPTTGEPGEIDAWLTYADGESNPALWKNDEALKNTEAGLSATDNESQAQYVIAAEDLAGKEAIYAPIYWGQSGIAFGKGVSAENYNSFTLLANWPYLFKKD
ncbi:MAG: ABC transporter substrate-binding protein [Clostridiales Family XIII bacterium]|jgi:peptide/nickel transport system substrate-binding protein|nr:ABC transporter substrate-binding protein [Clostridiales Family XIII bacterium]